MSCSQNQMSTRNLILRAAQANYSHDDISVDEDADFSPTDEGTWVQAWVYVTEEMVRMETPLCIYHGGCDDGFGAAMAVWLHLRGDVELYPGIYNKPPPLEVASGRVVYVVDFSYKRNEMLQLSAAARNVIVFDHHKTAANEIGPLLDAGHIDGVFDMERSGAMITWNELHPNDEPPDLIKYIQDRDLWRKELPYGDMVTMALRSYPQDTEVWEELLMDTPIGVLIGQGGHIHRYYRTLVDTAKARARSVMVPYGWTRSDSDHAGRLNSVLAKAVNCEYALASEVAGEICDDTHEMGLCYFQQKDGSWVFSLRSRSEFNVRKVAEHYGGGGHDKAAGFDLPTLPDWVLSRPK